MATVPAKSIHEFPTLPVQNNCMKHEYASAASGWSAPAAIITFSKNGIALAMRAAEALSESRLYIHSSAADELNGTQKLRKQRYSRIPIHIFDEVKNIIPGIWKQARGIVFIAPAGIAVRTIAPLIRSKRTDPAVAAADVLGRNIISLLSGHEGRANELELHLANTLGAEPVITTTTEAERTVIMGIGCRKGATSEAILALGREALVRGNLNVSEVRLIATVAAKQNEAGLIEAARILERPLRIIPEEAIRKLNRSFTVSSASLRAFNIPAVAEPCALLAGTRTEIFVKRMARHGVTIALAREFAW
ncbi:MAG TPA: cobalamin biosynthesis protein CbiG [Spirochaetia bacterium]|nr:cobalamin biosynthesis protein CbiG [Spirochaetia bacterium]